MLDHHPIPVADEMPAVRGMGWLRLDAGNVVEGANDEGAKALGYACVGALIHAARTFEVFSTTEVGRTSGAVAENAGWRPYQLADANGKRVEVFAQVTGRPGGLDVFLIKTVVGGYAVSLSADDGRYLPLLELSQSGFCISTGDTCIQYVNSAFAEMLGYEPDELIGRFGREMVAREDLPRAIELYSGREWRPHEVREAVMRLYMKHGMGVRDVLIRKARIKYQGADAYVCSVMDVTDLRRGEKALRDHARRLRRLSLELLRVQENERRNLARELHDEVGQQLTLVKLSLAQLSAGNEKLSEQLHEPLHAVSELMNQVRDISLDLRPSMLDDLGLAATIRWYVARVSRLAGLDARVTIADDFPRLDSEIETLFFRVTQEAVTNVMRHADAEILRLSLCVKDHHVVLSIDDDGQGFSLDAAKIAALKGGSAGLLGMEERAALAGATLRIESSPGRGCSLRLSLSSHGAGIGNFTT